MEEEKVTIYYEELTRKGEGAFRLKRGLGFSSASSTDNGAAGSPLRKGCSFISATSSSSFLFGFVKASGPDESKKLEKEAQLHSIQNKLRKMTDNERDFWVYDGREIDGVKDRDRGSDMDGHSRRWISRSRDRDGDGYDRRRDGEKERNRDGLRRRKKERGRDAMVKGPDYSKVFRDYENMHTLAERVKAKMKLQLAKTREANGMGHGWERFEFYKDTPLDDEEEVEGLLELRWICNSPSLYEESLTARSSISTAAEDDAALEKHIGQSFHFLTIQVLTIM